MMRRQREWDQKLIYYFIMYDTLYEKWSHSCRLISYNNMECERRRKNTYVAECEVYTVNLYSVLTVAMDAESSTKKVPVMHDQESISVFIVSKR